MGRASVPTPAVYPAFFFVLEKAVKSAGNAVISTLLTHRPPDFDVSGTNGLRLLSQVKVGTHLGSLRKIAHSGSQGETGVLWMGALSLPSDRFARSGNPAWPEGRTAYFAPFGSWPRVLSKNAESLRDSDALMRVADPRRRGPAGPRCSVCNLVMLLFFHSARRAYRTCERGGGITTLGALCVLLKCRTAAWQND